MTTQIKNQALLKSIKNLESYIQNADHSEPTSFEFIFNEENINSEEFDYIFTITQEYESFEVFSEDYGDLLLTVDQLSSMKMDLEEILINVSSI